MSILTLRSDHSLVDNLSCFLLQTCSRGTACNFIHCFRNPGGDYEWADSDRPPPKYWVRRMVALFGYSDADEKQMVEEHYGQLRNSSKMSMADSERYALLLETVLVCDVESSLCNCWNIEQ